MSSEQGQSGPSIHLDAKFLSFVLALVTLVSLLVGGITWVNAYTYRIDTLEKRNVELTQQISTLSATINDLNEKIVGLTISLNRLEERTNPR